jgi:hypothetical protein
MKIEQSEGTVYGCRYYTVKPQGWMYHGDNPDWNKIVTWVVATYGPTAEDGVWTPDQRWYVNNAKFWFRELEDVTMFLLKWS